VRETLGCALVTVSQAKLHATNRTRVRNAGRYAAYCGMLRWPQRHRREREKLGSVLIVEVHFLYMNLRGAVSTASKEEPAS
jgi:hypothetical protein